MTDSEATQATHPPPKPVFILDRPAHGGNIGAALRAMKNMGLQELRLVSPRQFPHADVAQFAAGAKDMIGAVRVFSSVSEAVGDLNFLVATSNRHRGQRQAVWTPRQLGERLGEVMARPGTRVGVLFGTERAGLETIDVERADVLCNIPTASSHGSLNLAQSVLVLSYEIMMGSQLGQSFAFDPTQGEVRAQAHEMERLFNHMEESLTEIEFLQEKQKRHMMGSLKTLFHRAAMDSREISIIRGILAEAVRHKRLAEKRLTEKG
ncbi:MAG: RNA methyltransferase [Magnetococcales bacterium]|nr:RNA methyltransferase [Magnetococcales bacterium]